MKFLKKIDHLKLLKIALAISIFSIGYLITMFYFQMQELKDAKQKIVKYNTANNNVFYLELEIEKDNYLTQTQILNRSIFSQESNSENKYISSFLKLNKNVFLDTLDTTILSHESKIKTLIKDYQNSKKQLFTENSLKNINSFNSSVINLIKSINDYNKYVESQIKIYNDNYDKLIESSKTSGFLIALISLMIFVLAYVKMHEDLYKLKNINDEILFINKTLNNAEMIAGFGSWKINTVTNAFLLSDNFYRLLGKEPKSFEPTLNSIVEFIHPEDREEVMKLHNESFANKSESTIVYRYLLENGTIKNMVSVGKFLNNSKGELVKIGVNQDITELMKKTQQLEDKNRKLISINSELESFNNIVSHDLQEPLRKIQMFISRIESKEFKESASEITLNYFEKVKSAANRMQNLMTDLVNYTRTIKGDRVFEEVDLNTIFAEIIEELAFTIEEKNATISIDQLPIILGTRFQIQQLFINLISNALKYVKPDISPVISVRLEEFSKDYINDKLITNQEYYKITVSDNGIGFEQKYADKIFMLFKRLETDQNYNGTGLGLAICKKIVDNNNGFITAFGNPDVGSTFAVYFPKNLDLSKK